MHGIFSTRAPVRPSPIGISIVNLTKREDNLLFVKNVDMIDKTPLLDIKPYVPEFNNIQGEIRIGWLKTKIQLLPKKTDDGRFISTK